MSGTLHECLGDLLVQRMFATLEASGEVDLGALR